MAKETRKQSKKDKSNTSLIKMQIFVTEHWKKIAGISGIVIIIIAAIVGFYTYNSIKSTRASMILSEAMKLFNEAEDAMVKNGDIPTTFSKYDTAKAKFQETIQNGGDKSIISEAIFLSARCSYQTKKYKEAISDYELFLKKYPKTPNAISARNGIAKSYEQIGDNESLRKAIQYYDELSKYPESYVTVEAFLNKGVCYEKLGEYEQALTAYKIVADRFKVKTETAIQLKSKAVVDKAKDAIKKYESALGKSSSDATFKSLLEKAESLEKTKKDQWFDILLAYDSAILSQNEYWHNQSASMVDSSKFKEAEKSLKEYENQSFDIIENVSMGRKYQEQGDWDTALRYYARATEFNFLPAREMYEKAQNRIGIINIAKQENKPQA